MVTAWAGGSAGAVEDIFEKNDTSTTKDKVEVISTWAAQRDHTHGSILIHHEMLSIHGTKVSHSNRRKKSGRGRFL